MRKISHFQEKFRIFEMEKLSKLLFEVEFPIFIVLLPTLRVALVL